MQEHNEHVEWLKFAYKAVIARNLQEYMGKENITQTAMAKKLGASRK